MDRYYTQTVGTQVMTIAGFPVSRILEIVIDPETGKVVGFLLAPRGEYVIAPADVVFWENSLFIQDEQDILETQEIIKVRQILERNIPILRARVYTKKGLFVGKVYDIAIDQKFFTLTKLVVAKNIFGFFPFDEKIIPYSHILEIKPDRIIIKDIHEKASEKEKSPVKEALKIDPQPAARTHEA